jgi:hypothetical protein
MNNNNQAKCPVSGCKEALIHHEIYGVPSPADPLYINMTKNVYECQTHGLLAYLGDGRFRQISD